MRASAILAVAILALAGCASSSSVPPRAVPPAFNPAAHTQVQTARPPVTQSKQGPFQPNANLFLCRGGITNQPRASTDHRVLGYAPMIVVNGVALATAPANDVCLTSGFGPRYGRPHKGVDLFSNPPGRVYSAAPGIIREANTARGFGKQIVIDHGRGVFTRYAHLSSFAPGIRTGAKIGFGVPIGKIGATGNATAPHLHYEVLTGSYNNPRKSFGLEAHNPLAFPAWAGLNTVS
ncbi:MAG: M23 family metallopeptidase [Pseudomonadota bacterium]